MNLHPYVRKGNCVKSGDQNNLFIHKTKLKVVSNRNRGNQKIRCMQSKNLPEFMLTLRASTRSNLHPEGI